MVILCYDSVCVLHTYACSIVLYLCFLNVEIDPYNLRIDHSTDGEITITWEPPPGSNENFTYTVTLSDRNGCYSNVFTTNDTTLLICGLDSSKKYDAAVQPINVEGYNTTVITVSGNG